MLSQISTSGHLLISMAVILQLLSMFQLSVIGSVLKSIRVAKLRGDFSKINKYLVSTFPTKDAGANLQMAAEWSHDLRESPKGYFLSRSRGRLLDSLETFNSLTQIRANKKCDLSEYETLIKNLEATRLNPKDVYLNQEKPRRQIDAVVATVLLQHIRACRYIIPTRLQEYKAGLDSQKVSYVEEAIKLLLMLYPSGFDQVTQVTLPWSASLMLRLLRRWTKTKTGVDVKALHRSVNDHMPVDGKEVVKIFESYMVNSCQYYLEELDNFFKLIRAEDKVSFWSRREDPGTLPIWTAQQGEIFCRKVIENKKILSQALIDLLNSNE